MPRARAELDGFLDELTADPRQAAAPASGEALVRALSKLTSPGACPLAGPDPAALARIERAARVIARSEVALARGTQGRAALLTHDALVLARAAGWHAQIAQALAVRAAARSSSERVASAGDRR